MMENKVAEELGFKPRVFITVAIEVNDWSGKTILELHRINYELREGDNIDDRFEELCNKITSQYAQ